MQKNVNNKNNEKYIIIHYLKIYKRYLDLLDFDDLIIYGF